MIGCTSRDRLRQALKSGVLAMAMVSGLVAGALVRPVDGGMASAMAAGYHVYTCRTPSGGSAVADGWTPSVSDSEHDQTSNTCATGGGLVAGLDSHATHPAIKDRATWAFHAPPGESIKAAALWRAGDAVGGANFATGAYYMFWLSTVANTGPETKVLDACESDEGCLTRGSMTSPFASENSLTVPGEAGNNNYISLNASCGILTVEQPCSAVEGDKNGYAAVVELFAADITLTQTTAPTVSGVEGGLASLATVGGASDVGFDAADTGSGVYEVVFQVDGELVQRQVLDENGGRCRDVGQTTDGLPAFLYTQPCLASLSVDVPFDTTRIANGQHHLVVSVTDAAGNSTPVLDREIVVSNNAALGPEPASARGPGNGDEPSERATLTARWKSTANARLTSAYGEARTIEGRVTGPDGSGIADAAIEVTATPAAAGAHPVTLPTARTTSDGRWTLRLPRDLSSCSLLIAYRSHLGDAQPAATRGLALGVSAGVMLQITPRVVSAGHSIVFSGRLPGGPIPPGGKQVLLEARSPGSGWVEFHVARANAKGRFTYSYRFRFPGPVNYQFRALCEHEADYPFLVGASSVVKVRER
jgi:hypothetical protein